LKQFDANNELVVDLPEQEAKEFVEIKKKRLKIPIASCCQANARQ